MSELEEFVEDYQLPHVLAVTLFEMGVFLDKIPKLAIKNVKRMKCINLKERRKFISIIKRLNY